MPGRRLIDPFLVNTDYPEAVSNDAELLTDWDGLVYARPIPIKYLGNSWFQGSYDNSTWDNYVENDHNYIRVSTDGGTTWRVIDLTGIGAETHPPVTIGSPDGGLAISGDDTQILTLSAASATSAGSMSSSHFTKVTNLKYDYLANVGSGAEVFKDYTDSGDTRTHNLKTLVSTDASVSFTENADTIDLSATGAGGGETNTATNIGTDGVGVFDNKNGVQFEFRNIASTHTGLTVTLDAVDNDIDLNLVESNIDHDLLQNFVANEHIDHSTVSILTQEGITGGGDLTADRTLTLSFDTLGSQSTLEDSDIFGFYRNESGEDLHYTISYTNVKSELETYFDTLYVPLTTGVYTYTGLTGGGTLDADRTIQLAFQDLPTVTYDGADYVAIYDSSNLNHAKVTLSDIVGELAVSITAGNGMDFTTITSTGSIDMGTPSTLTESTTNALTTTSHTHQVDMSTWELEDLGNVTATPTTNYYLQFDGANWITADPAIGASSPALPIYSVQFNENTSFGGNSGLVYNEPFDTLHLSNSNTSDNHGLNLGGVYIEGSLTVTGTGGSATLSGVAGLTTTITFDTDIATTLSNYVTTYSATYAAEGVTLTSTSTTLDFVNTNQLPFGVPVITDPTVDLAGSYAVTTINTDSRELIVDSGTMILRNLNDVGDDLTLISNAIGLGPTTIDSDTFLHIEDTNKGAGEKANIMQVFGGVSSTFLKLDSSGNFYLPVMASSTEDNVLYYDSTTGLVTYGAAPSGSGGGVSTLLADSLSGLMVNGGSTSSASTIELDQNDNKLVEAVSESTDYIGFYDVSTGLQSKTTIGGADGFPGWDLYLNGVEQEEIHPKDKVDFVEGSGIDIQYNTSTNALTISTDGTAGSGCSQLVDDIGTITDGNTGNLDLDIYSGGIMTIASAANVTLQFDNIQEGDTGHVEVSHSGNSELTIAVPGATDIKIATNSRDTGDKVKLSSIATIDVVAFWYAKGNFHVALIYDMQ